MRCVADVPAAVELLVLDAHGVIFNNPWSSFLSELALATERQESEVHRLWYQDLHDDAWLGVISDEELWSRLTGRGDECDAWRANLEQRYRLGDVAEYFDGWRCRVPIWVLSNHRTDWLLARLLRFGVTQHLDRILVSDELGTMKPDPAAFRDVVSAVSTPGAALFVDDRSRNVDSALQLGLSAVIADSTQRWVRDVDRIVSASEHPAQGRRVEPAAERK